MAFSKDAVSVRPPGKACKNKLLRQNCPITTLESNMSLWLFPLDDRLILREPLPLFVQPERVKEHDVIDPEVIRGVMPLDVVIPPVVEPLPGHREQRRVLLQDSFGLQDQRFALGLIERAIDLWQEVLECLVVPPGVI